MLLIAKYPKSINLDEDKNIKLLKLTIVGAIAGGIAAGAFASVVAKEMCKKKKKTSEEK